MLVLLLLCVKLCGGEESDLGYGLNIGNAIDVFAKYRNLSRVMQVISADSEGDLTWDAIVTFNDKTRKLFMNVKSSSKHGDRDGMTYCSATSSKTCSTRTFRTSGFKDSTDKSWKAFVGSWIPDELMRTFGIEYDASTDNCCYVLVKLTKKHKHVEAKENLREAIVKFYAMRAADDLNISDAGEVRRFIKRLGTHYIESYITGNSIYQVFQYKRVGYKKLRTYMRARKLRPWIPNELRIYFSSYYLKQVGDIRIASGNKTVETWAHRNLRDSQYLYSRPSLLRLHYNPILVSKLNTLLDNGALLGLGLNNLRPLFLDKLKAEQFAEIDENEVKLWKVNVQTFSL